MMTLVDGQEAEYERRHRELWPEMLAALTEAGYTNYTLFRSGLTVIGYVECTPDVKAAIACMAANPVNDRWNESFVGIIEPAAPGDYTVELTELWHID